MRHINSLLGINSLSTFLQISGDQEAERLYDAECQADRSASRFLGVLNSFDIVSMAFVWYYKTTHNASSQK